MFFHIRMTEGLESFVVRERGRPTGAATEPVKKWEPFVNVEEGCVRETRKGVLHEDDPHFSELFEALKKASACRKSFFDRLRAMPCGMAPEKTLRKKVTYVEERDHLRLRRSRGHSSFTAAASRHRPKASARVLRRFFNR